MTVRRLLLALPLLLGLSLPAMADRALIIGINKYPGLADSSQLNGAVNDAARMARIAEESWGFRGGDIKILRDEEATAVAIRESLKSWIADGTKPGDRALIYFSGHGYFIDDEDGDESDGRDEVLVASDARFNNGKWENLIVDDEIERMLRALAGRSVMLIADSCHSGTIERALRPAGEGEVAARFPIWRTGVRGDGSSKDLIPIQKTTEAAFTRLREDEPLVQGGQNLIVWTAAAATQVAQEDVSRPAADRNGVFTEALADGVQGTADADHDGKVTAAELLAFTRARSQAYCSKYACSTGMDPTFAPAGSSLAMDMSRWPANAGDGGGASPSAEEVISAVPPSAGALEVRAEIVPEANLRVGDKIGVRIASSRAGYVVVLDMRDDGKVYQLFPSVCSPPERTVRAGVPLLMPDPLYGCEFAADEAGGGKIVVVVTEDKVPLDALLDRTKTKGIEAVGEASEYLGAIVGQLMAVWTGDSQNRAVRWGIATAEYKIQP